MRKFIFPLIIVFWALALIAGNARPAHAQWYGLDSSEKVHSTLKTPIGSTDVAPIKVKVATGDGAKFLSAMSWRKKPIVVTLAPAVETPLTAIEEVIVTNVVGDSLTISVRALSNTSAQAWVLNSYIGIRVTNVVLTQLQDSAIEAAANIDSLFGIVSDSGLGLPAQTGNAGKVLTTNGSSLAWTLQPGSVVPVSLGGTGLTTLASGKLWYASALNTIAPLSVGTGLSIASSILSVSLSPFTTSSLAEGTNLYFTNARVYADITGTLPIQVNSGNVSIDTATSTTTGVLTYQDWNTFNAKQNALTLPLPIAFGGTGSTTRAAALSALLPDTTGLPDSVVLSKTGWVSIAGGGGGSGTVTSVAETVPGILSISGSPITAAGTLAIGLANEPANAVFAGPTTGSATTPTFRALVAADIPNLPASKITSGILPIANGGTGQSTAQAAIDALTNADGGTAGDVWATNGTNGAWQVVAGTGTVTSVGVSGGSTGLTTSGGPITGSGTITLGGTLGIGFGGTGLTSTPTAGQLLVGNGSGYSLATLTAGTGVGVTNGAGSITISNTGVTSLAAGSGISLTGSTGAITVSSTLAGGTVTSVSGSGGSTGLTLAGGPITTSGTLTLGGLLGTAYGGTGISFPSFDSLADSLAYAAGSLNLVQLTTPTQYAVSYGSTGTGEETIGLAWNNFTKGDILYASATNTVSNLPIGTSGQVLTVSAGLPVWMTPCACFTWPVGGLLPVDSGGTGRGTLTAHDVLVGAGTAAVALVSPNTAGYVLTSNGTSSDPSFQVSPSAPVGANPTATIGTSVVNGSATTFMRSDAAPAFGNLTGDVTSTGLATTIAALPNSKLANSTIGLTSSGSTLTITGSPISLGGTGNAEINLTNANTWTGAIAENQAGIAAAYTVGLNLENTTASTSIVPVQKSPSLELTSHVWSTSTTAHDSTMAYDITCVPFSSANPLASDLVIRAGNGSTNMQPQMELTNSGQLVFPTEMGNPGGGGELGMTSSGVVTATSFAQYAVPYSTGINSPLTSNSNNFAFVYSVSPAYLGLGGYFISEEPALGVTYTIGLAATNGTASTLGTTQQWPGVLQASGTALKSNATATSQTDVGYMWWQPLTGAAITTGQWVIGTNINAGGNVSDVTIKSSGDLELNLGHLTSASTIGAAVGDGSAVTSASVAGSDLAGVITITTAIGTNGYAQVTFGTPYVTAPVVVAVASNANGITAMGSSPTLWVSSSTTSFKINFTATAVAVGATFNYIILGPTP